MSTVKIITLIKTTLSGRGKGTEEDPCRTITEYWTLNGEKVFEIDPTKIIKDNEERRARNE